MPIKSVSPIELNTPFLDELACLEDLCIARWHGTPLCPHCGSNRIYHFSDRRVFKCAECRQKFTVRTGTIFEDSKLPIHKWFNAIWIVTQNTNGLTSTCLAKEIGVTQKTAWLMLRRLRDASTTKSFNVPLELHRNQTIRSYSNE